MHVIDIYKVAYIVVRAFTHITSFHFILKTFPSKSSDPSPILLHFHPHYEAMEMETQNDEPGGPQEILFKTTHLCSILYSLSLRIF